MHRLQCFKFSYHGMLYHHSIAAGGTWTNRQIDRGMGGGEVRVHWRAVVPALRAGPAGEVSSQFPLVRLESVSNSLEEIPVNVNNIASTGLGSSCSSELQLEAGWTQHIKDGRGALDPPLELLLGYSVRWAGRWVAKHTERAAAARAAPSTVNMPPGLAAAVQLCLATGHRAVPRRGAWAY